MELGTAAWFFLVAFPSSVYVWSAAVVGGGLIQSDRALPWEVRLSARMAGVKRDESDFAPMVVLGPALVVAFFNLSVPLALVGPYSPAAKAVVLAYVGVHLLWLRRVRRAIKQAR